MRVPTVPRLSARWRQFRRVRSLLDEDSACDVGHMKGVGPSHSIFPDTLRVPMPLILTISRSEHPNGLLKPPRLLRTEDLGFTAHSVEGLAPMLPIENFLATPSRPDVAQLLSTPHRPRRDSN